MLRKKMARHRLQLYLFMAVIVLIGLYWLNKSHAAAYILALEAEQGTISSPARLVTDASASEGAAVRFGPAPSTPAYAIIKLMPLGDSITNGLGYSSTYGGYGGYRVLLWQKLVQTDHDVIDFVGSAQNGPSNLGDHDVEGHDGWTINGGGTTALLPMLDGWLATYKPDIILLHAGTNDIRFGADGPTTTGRLDAMIAKIYTDLPNVKVVVAQPIRINTGDQTIVASQAAYEAAIPGVVNKYQAQGRTIQLVDMFDLLNYYDNDYSDGIHPSAHGYDKMAGSWYPIVSALYKSF